MYAGTLASLILCALASIHVYWAGGGRWGKSAAIPTRNGQPLFRPGVGATLFVALGLYAMAGLLLLRAGWLVDLTAHQRLLDASRAGTWLLCIIFVLRALGDFRCVGLCKSIRDSRFARLDTLIYTPLCVLLALLIALAAMG
ncbi:MAG: hypothetical protein BWK76_23605 [Desulfobulbaceae bacterium A2]|nr:MAG: hypothetical protein BWK76_23605 [Desulfobulbaceae bacterium A2]